MNPQRKPDASSSLNPGTRRKVQGGATVAALVVIPVLAVVGGDAFRAFIDFGAGVLSLLSLSGAVVWGLIATDRLLLSPKHRLLAQGVHRATAVASLGFLLLHISIKVSLGKVALIGALLPFGLGITGTNGLIGFGSLAGLLMVVAATTGALRSVFVPTGRFAGRWRAMHMAAYPAWCFALVHGLFAGRAAATYVTVMYSMTLIGVAAAVSVRLLPRPVQTKIAGRIVSMVGSPGEKAEPGKSRRDLSSAPLPGATGIPPQREYTPRPQQEPAFSAQPMGSSLGAARTPPRLAPPSPPVYEATRPSVDPMAETFIASRTNGFAGLGADPLADSGTGLSAGYRAASRGDDGTARIPPPPPGPPGSPPGGDIPFAERIPMTEEIPVISDEPSGRGGSWPAPSPPRPAQAFVPPTPAPSYDSGAFPTYTNGANQQFDTGATPAYVIGATPQYDTGATPAYDMGAAPQFDTGATPLYDPASVASYDTGAAPPYDTGAASAYGPDAASPYGTGPAPTYDTGAGPQYIAGSAPTYDTGAIPAYDSQSYGGQPYSGQSPATPPPSPSAFDGTVPPPGPLYPPQAGEPWNAPAGDRP
ncbi:hypothetical protein ACIOJD_08720 [Streptomyces sp. NPDC088116]|uniref:hypothetical protein n=1 Tax=Streptomyces sp. NPDC088116 TaxID=3365825 RepID=UPI00381CF671